jgi:hypothetical protein
MSASRPDAANFLLVNPLLDRREADPQLQGRLSKLQQFLNIPFGFALVLHPDAIVARTKFSVNSASFAWVAYRSSAQKQTKAYCS